MQCSNYKSVLFSCCCCCCYCCVCVCLSLSASNGLEHYSMVSVLAYIQSGAKILFLRSAHKTEKRMKVHGKRWKIENGDFSMIKCMSVENRPSSCKWNEHFIHFYIIRIEYRSMHKHIACSVRIGTCVRVDIVDCTKQQHGPTALLNVLSAQFSLYVLMEFMVGVLRHALLYW